MGHWYGTMNRAPLRPDQQFTPAMQKLFLLSFIIACLVIPVRRASATKPIPLGRVVTDFMFFIFAFGVFLRLFYGRLG